MCMALCALQNECMPASEGFLMRVSGSRRGRLMVMQLSNCHSTAEIKWNSRHAPSWECAPPVTPPVMAV